MTLKTNPKISSKELNSFIPIGKLRCLKCNKIVPVCYNGICEHCIKEISKSLVDIK